MAGTSEAKRSAISVLRQYYLITPTLDDLIKIIEQLGFSILDYSRGNEFGSTEALIDELGLKSLAEKNKSFVFKNGEIKLVFLDERLTAIEKRYALAHELGHIVLGHLKKGSAYDVLDLEEEHDANEFSHYLLHPNTIERLSIILHKRKVVAIICAIILLVGLLSIPVIQKRALSKSFYGEYYVTEKGDKYHVIECPTIRGRSNIHRLTKDEYESEQYAPCHICLPDNSD